MGDGSARQARATDSLTRAFFVRCCLTLRAIGVRLARRNQDVCQALVGVVVRRDLD